MNDPAQLPDLAAELRAQVATFRNLAQVATDAAARARSRKEEQAALVFEALAHARSACAQNLANLLERFGL